MCALNWADLEKNYIFVKRMAFVRFVMLSMSDSEKKTTFLKTKRGYWWNNV